VRVIAVPVKPLDRAKTRLSEILSPMERASLTLAMLEDVLDAALATPGWSTWVVSADASVLEVAASRGAEPVAEESPEPSLTRAVRQVGEAAAQMGADALAVVLADLPLLTRGALAKVLQTVGPLVLAPSHSDGGTNVLLRRPPLAIRARFGTRSFERHREEAAGAGLPVAVVHDESLAFDLDRPRDAAALLAVGGEGRTVSACREMGLAARLRVPAGRAAPGPEDS
jgi:2-phospho-L-lactate guanylyltransferase